MKKLAASLDILVGQTITTIEGLEKYSDEVIIRTEEGNSYVFYHSQDCCESVSLEDYDSCFKDDIYGEVKFCEEVYNDFERVDEL